MTHDVCGPGHHRHLRGAVRHGRQGVGPRQGRHHPRPLHLHRRRQGPPQRRDPARLRRSAGHHALLRPRLRRTAEGMPQPYADPAKTSYRGVCHVALPQNGHTRPGEVLLGTDSHTCTHGAFGEFATGIGNTEAGFVMGTGKLWLKVPADHEVRLRRARCPPYLMAKDLILHIIGDIGVDGATYRAMEFAGEAICRLNMDERMTLCNMAIEAGGKNGIIAADDGDARLRPRADRQALRRRRQTDADATYAAVTEFDVEQDRADGRPAALARTTAPPAARARRRQDRPRLHRLVHRRQDDRLPRRRDASCAGQQGPGRHVHRAGHHRSGRATWTSGQVGGKTLRQIFRGRRLQDRPGQLRRLPGRAGRHLRPGQRAHHGASRRPTATSPAGWATRRPASSWPAR